MRLPLADRLLRRELCEPSRYSQICGLYGDRQFIDDLDIVNELAGHRGCINALCWSRSGSLLASGSDDTNVNIYAYMPEHSGKQFTRLTEIHTGHQENIFSVKFMPHSNDQKIITCAGDTQVRIFDIERSAATHVGHAKVFRCHTASVKRIVTEASPFYFMTCSEDGTVRQWDIRQNESYYPPKFRGRGRNERPPPLISYAPYNMDLFSLSCSPSQPHYIALGGNHMHCFLHDRRMLGRDKLRERAGKFMRSADRNRYIDGVMDSTRCVAKFAPFGQPKMTRNDTKHITACKLGVDNPNELIVSWSGDHVYLFDILRDQGSARKFSKKDPKKRRRTHGPDSPSSGANSRARTTEPDLEEVMSAGNGVHLEFPMFREYIRQRLAAGETLDENSGTAHATRVKQVQNALGETHFMFPLWVRNDRMVRILIHAAEALDKIDEYISQRTYPVTRSSAIVDYELKLRGDRAKVWRFVQTSGTIARVLLGYKQQPVPNGEAREVTLELFDMVRPARREGSQTLDRHEQFGYDFIKTILLWLDSGVGAVLREFSPESQYSPVGTSRRFPVSRDAGIDALETQLIPYLMSLATDLPVEYPEYGVPHLDENAHPAVALFVSEKAAVQALGGAMRRTFADLYDDKDKNAASPDAVLNDREAAVFFWGVQGVYRHSAPGSHRRRVSIRHQSIW
jgi:DDB1- and CUL4-associated factor 6